MGGMGECVRVEDVVKDVVNDEGRFTCCCKKEDRGNDCDMRDSQEVHWPAPILSRVRETVELLRIMQRPPRGRLYKL